MQTRQHISARLPLIAFMGMILALALSMFGAPRVVADEVTDAPRDYSADILPYIAANTDGVFVFDTDRAAEDGVSSDVLEVGDMFNAFAHDMSTGEAQDACLRGIPIWGNWCGPGHGGGPTKDHLDWSCKQHDECYAARGYLKCSCDDELIANINRLLPYMSGAQARTASVVKAYFSVSPCR